MTAVLWQSREGGSELCVLEKSGRGRRLRGTVLAMAGEEPVAIRYQVEASPAWVTEDAEVSVSFAGGDLRDPFTPGELWSGKERPPEFANCADYEGPLAGRRPYLTGFSRSLRGLRRASLKGGIHRPAPAGVDWLHVTRARRASGHSPAAGHP